MSRRVFTPDDRRRAVQAVVDHDHTPREVAEEYGVHLVTIYRWMTKAGRPARAYGPNGECVRGHDAKHREPRADRNTTRCSECHREDNRKAKAS